MSGFIYRDYATPRLAFYNNKVALKALWGKIQPIITVDGIPVFKKYMYWYGAQGTAYTEVYKTIRNDKEFVRFLKKIGTTHKKLRRQSKEGILNMFFWLNSSRLNYTTTTPDLMASKFNDDYARFATYQTTIDPNNVIIYPQGTAAGTFLYTPAVDTTVDHYAFYYGGLEHDISEDGYFGMHPNGMIYMTLAGSLSTANKVKYDTLTPNDVSYPIKTVYTNPSTPPVYSSKMLVVNRDYVDIKITVGGKYTKGLVVNNINVNIEALNLPTIRSVIEGNPTKYISSIADDNTGIYNMLDETLHSIGSINNAAAGVMWDRNKGNFLDVLALYDTDHSVFEVVNDCFNEQIYFKEVGDATSDTTGSTIEGGTIYSNKMNVEYSYYKRYKVKGNVLSTSQLITNIGTASDRYKTAIRKVLTPANLTAKTLYRENENVMYDSELQEAVVYLNTIGVEDAAFYKGYLRVDAFNAMTPNQFALMFAEAFRTSYTPIPQEGGSFLDEVLAVVIVIIAVVIAVVVYIFTGNAQLALSAANMWLGIAGMWYAYAIGDPTGMRIIGAAQQTIAVASAVLAIIDTSAAIEQYIENNAALNAEIISAQVVGNDAALETLRQTANDMMFNITKTVGMSALTVYGQLGAAGIIEIDADSEFSKILGAGMAVYGAYQSGESFISTISDTSLANSGLLDTTFKGLSSAIQLAGQTMKAYMLLDTLNDKQEQYASNEHATNDKTEQHEYYLVEQQLDNDALYMLESRVLIPQFGGNNTDISLSKML